MTDVDPEGTQLPALAGEAGDVAAPPDVPPGGDDAAAEGAFAFYSMSGKRFDLPGMPADTARELAYFEAAIYEAARDEYLRRNQDRARVPEGFRQAFDLRLTAVDSGSSRPRMMLRKPAELDSPTWDDWSDIFATARDQVTGALRVVDRDKAVPSSLSPRVRASLKRVGSTLEPSERIRVGHPTIASQRADLDESTRRVLAKIDDDLPPTPREHTLEGVIVEYDGIGRSFKLRTSAGLSSCSLEHGNSQLAEFARSVLALDGVTAPDVSVVGETLDASVPKVNLFNVNSIDIVRSFDEKALVTRLEQLAELEDGWLGAGTRRPTADVLSSLQLILTDLSAAGRPVDLIPAADGSVVVEWQSEAWEYTAALTTGGQMILISDNTETDDLHETQVDFQPAAFVDFLMRGVLP